MPKYRVEFSKAVTDILYGSIDVEAEDENEAKHLAISADMEGKIEFQFGQCGNSEPSQIDSVEEIKETNG